MSLALYQKLKTDRNKDAIEQNEWKATMANGKDSENANDSFVFKKK